MKTIFSFATIMCMSVIVAFAAKLTVDKSPLSAAQYADLPAAVSAANSGDTIYVYGAVSAYSDVTIDKKLVLIGSGAYPQVTNEVAPKISSIYFHTGSDGSIFTGFEITYILYAGYVGSTSNNVWIFNNRFSGQYGIYVYGTANNWIIEGNSFGTYGGNIYSWLYLYSGTWNNWMIKNNYFESLNDYAASGAPLLGINSSLSFVNNLFVFGLSYTYNYRLIGGGSTGGVFDNNIIRLVSPSYTNINENCASCVFNNNVIWNTAATLTAPTNGSNNIINNPPTFVNANLSNTYNLANNYSLAVSSPSGKGQGTDGTDVGLYGGNFNWNNRLYPKIFPHQEIFNVINQSVPQGTPVNVQLKSRKAFN